jgi:hypothetical protein
VKRRHEDPARRSRALIDLGIREAQRRGWNDTYTFSKWLGEQIACREMAHGTLAIVRPAIVESACREPQPGRIEGMKVGDAIVFAYARGKTRLFPARSAGVADIIPVNLVANSIILATAEALARPGLRRRSKRRAEVLCRRRAAQSAERLGSTSEAKCPSSNAPGTGSPGPGVAPQGPQRGPFVALGAGAKRRRGRHLSA